MSGGAGFEVRSCVEGAVWPPIPGPGGASLLALQFQYQQSERWAPARLLAAQLVQLRVLLEHAVAQVPWYASHAVYERALRAGLDEQAWTTLPVLERAQVQGAGDGMFSAALPHGHGRRHASRTTGSTGTPLNVETTDLTQLHACALMLRDHFWHGRDFTQKLAVIRGRVEGAGADRWQPGTGDALRTGPMVLLDITRPMTAQIEWLCAQDPGYLLTPTSNARELALEFGRRGLRLPSLKAVRVFGEMPAADLREVVREAWNVPVQDTYSAEETGPLALQCPAGAGYHVMAENLLVEVLDDDGRVCEPGEVGRVVVSTLHNFAMPLLRYHLGDHAEVGRACGCGRTLPVLSRILGRRRNMLRLPDGSARWPRLNGKVWRPYEVIRQIQVAQTAIDRLQVRMRVTRPLDDSESGSLREALRAQLDWPGGLDFCYRHEPLHRPGAKFEDFVNEMNPREGLNAREQDS